MAVYEDVLSQFKQKERPEVVLCVVDDAVATRVLLAWSSTRVGRKARVPRLAGLDEIRAWEWLWANTRYSVRDLADKSGVSQAGVRRKMAELAGNRVLYPDGSLNSFVSRYLRKRVADVLSVKVRRRMGETVERKPASG